MCNIAFVTVALINARWRHTHISMGVIICALFDTFQQLLLATSVIKYLLGRHTFLAHLHSEHTKLPLLSGLQSLFFLQSDYEVVDCYLCRGQSRPLSLSACCIGCILFIAVLSEQFNSMTTCNCKQQKNRHHKYHRQQITFQVAFFAGTLCPVRGSTGGVKLAFILGFFC